MRCKVVRCYWMTRHFSSGKADKAEPISRPKFGAYCRHPSTRKGEKFKIFVRIKQTRLRSNILHITDIRQFSTVRLGTIRLNNFNIFTFSIRLQNDSIFPIQLKKL
jgi:hypothetical protein